jgi:hypothetical protein
MKDMQVGLIVVVVLAVIVSGGSFIYSKIQGLAAKADIISDNVIQRYVELLQSGKYKEAWETCLSEQARKEIPVEVFIAAKKAHSDDFGVLNGYKRTEVTDEGDINSTLLGIGAVLEYKKRDLFVKFQVNPDVEPYRIHKIFGSSGNSSSLSEGVW